MENEYKPPPKRHIGFAFLFAGIGLFLLNAAANFLMTNKGNGLGWMSLASGLGLIVLAVWWAVRRI